MQTTLTLSLAVAIAAFGAALATACESNSSAPAADGGARNSSGRDGGADASAGGNRDAAQDSGRDANDASRDSDDASTALCSGCEDEERDASDMTIHLHHVHMNVSDRARSFAFYEEHFGAQRTLLNAETEALVAGPILVLLDEVEEPPSSALPTALQHVGWGAVDPIAWFEEHKESVEPDTRGHSLFATNETPTPSGTGEAFKALVGIDFPACFTLNDAISYIYVLGPDDERIELWSGDDDRVNHLHFTTADMTTALAWYARFLDVDTGAGTFFHDGILFFFEPDGDAASYQPTDSHVLGHLAFSVTDLAAWRERVADLDIEVVAEPAEVHGFESFFVRGPDGLLIELVQAAPSPMLCPATP